MSLHLVSLRPEPGESSSSRKANMERPPQGLPQEPSGYTPLPYCSSQRPSQPCQPFSFFIPYLHELLQGLQLQEFTFCDHLFWVTLLRVEGRARERELVTRLKGQERPQEPERARSVLVISPSVQRSASIQWEGLQAFLTTSGQAVYLDAVQCYSLCLLVLGRWAPHT